MHLTADQYPHCLAAWVSGPFHKHFVNPPALQQKAAILRVLSIMKEAERAMALAVIDFAQMRAVILSPGGMSEASSSLPLSLCPLTIPTTL